MKSCLNHKNFFVVSFCVAVVCVFGSAAFGQPWSGSGTPNDPYQIWDACDMQAIGANSVYWDAHFVLCADINIATYTGTSFNIIGNDTNDFAGVFDGNGHTISNFRYDSNDANNIGLFGVVGMSGEIKQLGLIEVNISSGQGYFIGALAGVNHGDISNCYVVGSIVGGGGWTLGGLIGQNFGYITDCYFKGSVYGDAGEEIGGLVGDNYDGTIANCYATGRVWADVNSGTEEIGGLAGENGGPIFYSWAECTVTGNFHVGGLVGHNYDSISNSYAKGSVSGDCVGGLAGASYWGTIINCYASGGVSGNACAGGLVGDNDSSTVSNSFWDVNSSGVDVSAGGTGKTSSKMQDANTFTDVGWDFNTPIWKMCDGPDYPSLWWEECPVLDPTELIAGLLEEVGELELPRGIENGLEVKLNAALRALEDENENNDIAAINTLGAFINAVEAQRGKKIPEAEADALIAAAQEIIELLSDG